MREHCRNSTIPIESLADDPATEMEDQDLKELFEAALSRLDTELCVVIRIGRWVSTFRWP